MLQGERDAASFERLREYFGALTFCPSASAETHAEAALIYARCRRQGLTLRSANDAVIARQAVESDLLLLHDDADFGLIARVEPLLRLV